MYEYDIIRIATVWAKRVWCTSLQQFSDASPTKNVCLTNAGEVVGADVLRDTVCVSSPSNLCVAAGAFPSNLADMCDPWWPSACSLLCGESDAIVAKSKRTATIPALVIRRGGKRPILSTHTEPKAPQAVRSKPDDGNKVRRNKFAR
jgi:hypothetical protein